MPAWSPDGRELYFCTPDDKLMAARVNAGEDFVIDAARPLFEPHLRGFVSVVRNQYAVTRDGKFVINESVGEVQPAALTLMQNWNSRIAEK